LKVTERLGKPNKLRKCFVFCGLSQGQKYAVYNNNLPTIERALLERVFYVARGDGFVRTPKPTDDAFDRLETVLKHFQQEARYAAPLTAMQFAGSYVGRRRVNYERAASTLAQIPLGPMDSTIRAFIKAEKQNFTVKSNPAPRIIQPRDPRYIVECGRYIKVIEKNIYKTIDKLFEAKTVFKGLNAEKRGYYMFKHWNHFNDPVAVGLDASRFDQHVSQPALKWEHTIYKTYYPRDKYFAQILQWQLQNRGVARAPTGTVKYTTDGCRMSGDSNTALGNCLLMSSMVYAFAESLAIEIRLANDGDDCVVIMEKEHLLMFQQHIDTFFTHLGFKMVVEPPVYIFEEIEFCQCHPVFDGQKYIMVRDPRVAISKDTVAIKPLDNVKVMKRWAAAVGEGGMHLTGGIPVWQDFYSYYVRVGKGSKPLTDPSMETGMQRMARGLYRKYSEPSIRSRVSFYLAFKISPNDQYILENYYRNIEPNFESPGLRHVVLPLPGLADDDIMPT